MATRLNGAGITNANGFALNVSNFYYTSEQVTYGNSLSALVGGKHYVIDTSRNGLGSLGDDKWCNPEGRALGDRPTTATGNALADAFLWIKIAGESDGACNGAPAAGTWMPEYALGLAQRAAY
jgi:endoglucanase